MKRQILAKKYNTKKEENKIKEFLKGVDPKIMRFKNRIRKMGSDTLPNIIGDIQDGYSPIILICGRQRIGKTRFGVTLANIFSVFLYYQWLNPDESFFLEPKRVLQNMTDEGYQIFVLDEAGASGSGINKRQWYSELNELFDYVLQTQGTLQNIYIFILPFASDLTTDIRKYVDYLMAGKKRGLFKSYKIYKREDQLVKNLKAFKQVWIEMLQFDKSDLPASIWKPVDAKCEKIKRETRVKKLHNIMNDKDNWLVK